MNKWKTRHVEDVIETPFVHIQKEIVELPGGQIIDDYLVHEYPDWVNAVVLTKQRNVVLVNQYRHAGKDSFLEIPAGKRD
ncbi:hypothetical protein [Halobacillus locisalis]|uniref:hypothetical protein n=1 Tax=Halobacillus locisalis TaxID=220753 RepID=UPI001FE77C40|nr:hypothetical protein [Halobacillus locisalis]